MSELEIQQSIIKALSRMSLVQQLKLLEFINAMQTASVTKKTKGILNFAGTFDATDAKEFESSMRDCEQIDKD